MRLPRWSLILAVVAPTVSSFAPLYNNVLLKSSSTSSSIHSSVLPIPTKDIIGEQQPELGEDDLYITPPERNPPVAGSIMKMLPKETFDIDTPTSLFYFGVDLLAVIATMGFLDAVVTSDIYHALPMYAQALSVAPLQVLTGFAMW